MVRSHRLLLLTLLLHTGSAAAEPGPDVPAGLRCLLRAYPEQLCDATATELLWCDGTRMAWDDGTPKPDHDLLLNTADLQDQMAQRYVPGRSFETPPLNFEPGRIRHEPFFRKMYGDNAASVRRSLTRVRWLGGKSLRVTTINGVADKLRAISDEVAKLPAPIRKVVSTTAGTFNWRVVRGTHRASMHSFAIAIDVGVRTSDYWRWAKPNAAGLLPWRNRIPLEVVEIFERHGFIWGGKWYHFDTMHFEYRPELLEEGCAAP